MIEIVRKKFLGNLAEYSSNVFERAKVQLVFDFLSIQFIANFLWIALSLISQDYYVCVLILISFFTNIFSIYYLKFSKSASRVAWITSLNIILLAFCIVLVGQFQLNIMHVFQWVIAFVFTYFCLGKKQSIYIAILIFILTVISSFLNIYFKDAVPEILNNPSYNPFYITLFTPIVTAISLGYLFLLLNFYRENQIKAFSKVDNANDIKNSVLSVVAHDLRSPLSSIKMANELIKYNLADPKNDDGENLAYSKMIDGYADRGLALITDLMDAAELSKETVTLSKEKIEIVSFISELVLSENVSAKTKNIEIQLEKPDFEQVLSINTSKIARVLNNVISNAIKFTAKGGKIYVKITSTKKNLVISVRDTGIGIPDKFKDIIFEKFTTAGRRGTNGEKSLGLGMSISKKIIELHNGKIWFDSTENVGTTFYIELPI